MGKGRAPCCDKNQVKKGSWSPAEDLRLIAFIQKHGHENWRALPKQAGLLRCGKSCRLRWINYLKPDVKRGNFTKEEEDTIIKLHQTLGNKWSKIASHLPGRTDNEIKNVWNTHLKKKLTFQHTIDSNSDHDQSKESSMTTTTTTSSSSSSSSSTVIFQAKKRNNNASLDHQWTKRPRVLENSQGLKEAKEILLPTSSTCSNNSNVTNHHQLCNSVFNFSGPYHDIHNTSEEVNKPDQIEKISTVEIPFESDFDFWDMLDGLNSIQSSTGEIVQLNNIEITSQSSSSLGDVENRKWLRYLENELGLETKYESSAEDAVIINYEQPAESFQYED